MNATALLRGTTLIFLLLAYNLFAASLTIHGLAV